MLKINRIFSNYFTVLDSGIRSAINFAAHMCVIEILEKHGNNKYPRDYGISISINANLISLVDNKIFYKGIATVFFRNAIESIIENRTLFNKGNNNVEVEISIDYSELFITLGYIHNALKTQESFQSISEEQINELIARVDIPDFLTFVHRDRFVGGTSVLKTFGSIINFKNIQKFADKIKGEEDIMKYLEQRIEESIKFHAVASNNKDYFYASEHLPMLGYHYLIKGDPIMFKRYFKKLVFWDSDTDRIRNFEDFRRLVDNLEYILKPFYEFSKDEFKIKSLTEDSHLAIKNILDVLEIDYNSHTFTYTSSDPSYKILNLFVKANAKYSISISNEFVGYENFNRISEAYFKKLPFLYNGDVIVGGLSSHSSSFSDTSVFLTFNDEESINDFSTRMLKELDLSDIKDALERHISEMGLDYSSLVVSKDDECGFISVYFGGYRFTLDSIKSFCDKSELLVLKAHKMLTSNRDKIDNLDDYLDYEII